MRSDSSIDHVKSADETDSHFTYIAGVAGMLIGTLVLLGWVLDNAFLKSIYPTLPSMKANAAAGAFLAGLALVLSSSKLPQRRWMAGACAALVTFIAMTALLENLGGWDIDFGELLVRDPGSPTPGLIRLPTTLHLSLLGSALLLLGTRRGRGIAQWLGLAAVVVSAAAIINLQFGGSHGLFNAPLHASGAGAILGLGVIAACFDRELVQWARKRSSTLTFAVAVSALAMAGGSICLSTFGLIHAGRQVTQTHALIGTATELLRLAADVETGSRGYAATGDESFLVPFQSGLSSIDERQRDLRNLTKNHPKQQRRLDRLALLIQRKVEHSAQTNELRRSQGLDAAVAHIRTGEGKGLMDDIRAVMDEFSQGHRDLLQEQVAEAEMDTANAVVALIVGGTTGLALLLGLFLSLRGEISERERAEQALEKNEERLRLAVAGGGLGTWHWDIGANELDFSEHCKALFGMPPEAKITYEWFLRVLHPDDRDWVDRAVKTALKDRSEYGVEYRIFWPDKSLHWITARGRGYYTSDGRPVRMEGVVFDVTAQKTAERELWRSNQRFELVADGIDEGIWDWDLENNQLYFSPRWKAQLGYREDELKNEYSEWESRLHPDDQQTAAAHLKSYLDNRVPAFEIEYRMRHKDGSYRWILARGLAARRSDGTAYRAAGSHTDITDTKRVKELNTELLHRTGQLEAANKELESFSYSVSHDLRAPLRYIAGYVDLLRKHSRETLDSKSQRYLEEISTSATEMGMLIDDLLTFSRIGRAQLSLAPVNLNQVVQEARESLSPDTKGRHITWRVNPLPSVHGDYAMLRQVLRNLLQNAVKYTRPREHAVIEIGTRAENGANVVFVKDNGVGFDMKYVDKLFGVFQRLHSTQEFEGTGIGLALVHRIISRHGGRTWAEGVVDSGATFGFSLPK